MTEPEDQILVRRALQADPEGFAELCRRYYHSLVSRGGFCFAGSSSGPKTPPRKRLPRRADSFPGLKKPERFGPWIIAICYIVYRRFCSLDEVLILWGFKCA